MTVEPEETDIDQSQGEALTLPMSSDIRRAVGQKLLEAKKAISNFHVKYNKGGENKKWLR